MNAVDEFNEEKRQAIGRMAADDEMQELSRRWFERSCEHKYSYNSTWLGRPIIQYPQDILATQEIIWAVKPDLIVETGIAHGGSLIFSASMLELLGGDGEVLGIDIDIRPHNRCEIEQHPMFRRITMLEGSSVDRAVVDQVNAFAASKKRVLVILDSNHTHQHVFKEMTLYAPLVKRGSYMIVYDTVVEDMPAELCAGRPWGKGNSPKTAVWEFLKNNDRFEVDKQIEAKLQVTVAPDGYLRCVKDSA